MAGADIGGGQREGKGMTEHVHEYGLDKARAGYYCIHDGCLRTLLLEDAIPRLNATERLNWHTAINAANELDAQGWTETPKALRAYADIREGK